MDNNPMANGDRSFTDFVCDLVQANAQNQQAQARDTERLLKGELSFGSWQKSVDGQVSRFWTALTGK